MVPRPWWPGPGASRVARIRVAMTMWPHPSHGGRGSRAGDGICVFTSLQRLELASSITGKDLVTAKRHPVAARLDEDSFFKSPRRMLQALGVTGEVRGTL